MMKLSMAAIGFVWIFSAAQAHQIWIEQAPGQSAIIRFGEFGDFTQTFGLGLGLVMFSGDTSISAGLVYLGILFHSRRHNAVIEAD